MYCDKCGSQIPEDTGVCPNCGKSGNINTANADAIKTTHKKNNRPIIIIAVFILIIAALLGCLLVFNVFGNNTSLFSSDKSMWDVLPQIDYTPVEELEYEYDDSLSGIIITRYTGEPREICIPETIDNKPVVGVVLRSPIKELVVPDTVKKLVFNKGTVRYVNYPVDLQPALGREDGYDEMGYEGDTPFDKSYVETIYISKGVKEIPECMFEHCENLKETYIPSSVTVIGDEAFYGCKSLTDIVLSDGVTVIGEEAFADCYSLTDVVIPDGVTVIGEEAFANCYSLLNVTVPSTVKECGLYAFDTHRGSTALCDISISYRGKVYTDDNIGEFYYNIRKNGKSFAEIAQETTATEAVVNSDDVLTYVPSETASQEDIITTTDETTEAASTTSAAPMTTTAADSTTGTAAMTTTTADITTSTAEDVISDKTYTIDMPLVIYANNIDLYDFDNPDEKQEYGAKISYFFNYVIMKPYDSLENGTFYDSDDNYLIIRAGDTFAGHTVSKAVTNINNDGDRFIRIKFADEIALSGTLRLHKDDTKQYSDMAGDGWRTSDGDITFIPDESYSGLPYSGYFGNSEQFVLGNIKDDNITDQLYDFLEYGDTRIVKKVNIVLSDLCVGVAWAGMEGPLSEAKIVSVEEANDTPYPLYSMADVGDLVSVTTFVQAKEKWSENNGIGRTSMFVQNTDGEAYYIYNANCTKEEYDSLAQGTKVKITGYKDNRIANATVEIIEGETYIAEPIDVTGISDLWEYNNRYVLFKNVTVEAFSYGGFRGGTEGDDLYIYTSHGEKHFIVETDLCGADSDVYNAVKNLNIGDTIDIECFIYVNYGAHPLITAIRVVE